MNFRLVSLPVLLSAMAGLPVAALAQSSASTGNAALAANTTNAAVATPVPAGSPQIVYTFSHPQLQPAKFSITVGENGDGHFVSEPGNQPVDTSDDVYPAPMDRRIQLDEELRGELFQYARAHGFFNTQCQRTQGKLAFTGDKTLSYTGGDGHGSCAFVWAADPALQRLSDQLQAVALTLEIGRRLDVEVRHERLGLDAELQTLQDAVQTHRATDLRNIAPELRTIIADQQVMERARKRALALLNQSRDAEKAN